MSQQNVEVVRRAYNAYLSGNYETALAAYHPEVVFDVTVLGSVYRGREGVAKAIRRWTGTWSDWKVEVEELIDAGDRVLAVVRASGRGKGSGVDVAQRTFWTFSLRAARSCM
jgi:ketosteroid isomerase-like protein